MNIPLIPATLVNLSGPVVERPQPSTRKASRWKLGKTYITACSAIAGLLLVSSLTDLPLVIQGLLGGMLGLVIYGMVAASFRQLRFGLLVGLLVLTSFNLIHGLMHFDFESQHQAMFWAKSASEELNELFSNPEQYHLLADELFVSHAYWQKHSNQLKPLQNK